MKKIIVITILLTLCLPAVRAYSQSDTSCLKLIRFNEHNDYLWLYNTDSVRVDSCTNSPYYLQRYAKKYFYFFINKHLKFTTLPLGELVIKPASTGVLVGKNRYYISL